MKKFPYIVVSATTIFFAGVAAISVITGDIQSGALAGVYVMMGALTAERMEKKI